MKIDYRLGPAASSHRVGIVKAFPAQGLKYGSFAIGTNAACDAGEESIRQSVSLFIWNQTSAFMPGNIVLSEGRMPAIQAALSPPSSALAVSGIMIGFPFVARLA